MHPTVVVFPHFCIVLTQWRNLKKLLVGGLQGPSVVTGKKVERIKPTLYSRNEISSSRMGRSHGSIRFQYALIVT
jgi:hypothetical protein